MFNKTANPNEWENVYLEKYGMFYSRIIASWSRVYVDYQVFGNEFKDWLRSIKDAKTGERILTEDQVRDIYNLATNGKLEWQENARRFINEHK